MSDNEFTAKPEDAAAGQAQAAGVAQAGEQKASTEQAKQAAAPKKAPVTPNSIPPLGPPPMNPYMAGLFLGLTLLASYLILGAGLGASGAFARAGAWLEHMVLPAHTEASAYFGKYFPSPLSYYLVFMTAGVFAGGLISALAGGRIRVMVERGPTASRFRRLLLALIGGCLAGFASRLAMGCTSGQALSGGAMLLTGSLVFMGCLFATGFLTAWAFRRQWK